jgi:4-diphosphocytidyl-2-C-methyl-D-erythritol kinase
MLNLQEGKSFFSPAKLNLFFRVLNRRSDGFHEIASLYQAISLGDTLSVSLAGEDRFTCNDPDLPCDSSNLVMIALNQFRQKTGYDFKVHFHLEKKIPIQAGLGGGSSNAATAMWVLNALAPTQVSEEELCRWASEFSSDAPFFFSEGTAYCSGRGEILEHLPSLPNTELWLAKPSDGLSTPLVYKHCRPEQFERRDPKESLAAILKGLPAYFNDLEIPAYTLLPKLATVRENLRDLGFTHVVMTGSGTAFFCLGTVEDPVLSDVCFYPISFHNRLAGSWYPFPFEPILESGLAYDQRKNIR